MGRLRCGAAWIALAAAGCAAAHSALPVEPDVSFAAHRDGGALVVDRLPGGGTGLIAPAGRFRLAGTPDMVLRVGGETRAALWVIGHSRVLVRDAPSTMAPRSGEVLSTWDGPAIRLIIYTRDGTALRTDVFGRAEPGTAGLPLSREGPGGVSPVGSYRAEVRDAHDLPVGWLRVQLEGTGRPLRIYDAVLPPAVDGALAAAAVVALDAEIGWIEEHR